VSLHEVVLTLHSAMRWLVLGSGGLVLVRAVSAARAKRAWTEADAHALRLFTAMFDAQLLVGLFMYFGTSALGVRMLAQGSVAMKSSVLRFFALEHAFGMIVAATVLHAGVVRARKRHGEQPARQRATAIVIAIALGIVLLTIPWPIFPYARPLLRFG